MKVKEILPPKRSELTVLANMLMQQRRFNNPLFESISFRITTMIDHPSYAFHRLYWETCCTKTDFTSAPLSTDGKVLVLQCSLSECIQLIQKCTPPRFQARLNQEMQSIEDVTDLLKMYLMDPETGYLDYYLSIFTKVMHLEYTDAGFRPSLDKIDFMMQHNKGTFVAIVEASTVPLGELMTHAYEDIDNNGIQFTLQAHSEKECAEMYEFIMKNPLLVDNVYVDRQHGICVSCYATDITDRMIRKIKECYTQIMK